MIRRRGPKGVLSAPFGLSFFVFAVTPNQIGHQDVAALIARQPSVTAHWRQHVRASAFGTIHKATFSFSRPVGTAMPQPLSYQLANLDPRYFTHAPWHAPEPPDDPPLQFPKVDRSAKGDRLPVRNPTRRDPEAQATPPGPAMSASQPEPQKTIPVPEAQRMEAAAQPAEGVPDESEQPLIARLEEATIELSAPEAPAEITDAPTQETAVVETPAAEPLRDDTLPLDEPVETPPAETPAAENAPADIPDPVDAVVAEATGSISPRPVEPVYQMARLYFGDQPLGGAPGEIEEWAPGEAPTILAPQIAPAPADRDIKQSALDPKHTPADDKGGETIARKGEVTGEGKRPLTPAEQLKLEGKDRAKAEKCLADAVYFKSRGEPVRGQISVAQVVMNRVFSGYYPRNVCGTVYQNKHRRLACQFTFACDGIPDVVTDPQAWGRATRIAREVLDGKYWVPEVNRATHYHAYWVRPSWVREMKRLYKFGVHTFYRPRKWGDGSDMPSWGSAEATKEAIAKL